MIFMEPGAEKDLWLLVDSGSWDGAREKLIAHYLPLARIIAAKLYSNRHFNDIHFDDYLQFATVGLIESVDRFDVSRGVTFATFASARIRGSVLNGLESLSDRQQQISMRKRLLQQRVKSITEDIEGESDATFIKLVEVAIGLAVGYMLEGSGLWQDERANQADNLYEKQELKQISHRIRGIVDSLPDQSKAVIKGHYFQGRSFEDISAEMTLTKGRISQIHRKALTQIREAYEKSVRVELHL